MINNNTRLQKVQFIIIFHFRLMNQPFETALPELDDNFVFYRLFPQHADTDMADLLQQIQAHAYMLSQEYLWHHDPFHVRVYQSSLTLLGSYFVLIKARITI